jgi:hypothetical protein
VLWLVVVQIIAQRRRCVSLQWDAGEEHDTFSLPSAALENDLRGAYATFHRDVN